MFKYVYVDADLLGEEHGVLVASIRSYCIQILLELLIQTVQCLWLSVLTKLRKPCERQIGLNWLKRTWLVLSCELK